MSKIAEQWGQCECQKCGECEVVCEDCDHYLESSDLIHVGLCRESVKLRATQAFKVCDDWQCKECLAKYLEYEDE